MAIGLPAATRNAAADAVVDLADAGSGAAYIELRSGSKPATPGDTATGTLLVTFTLNDPAFGNAGASAAGRADLSLSPAISATGAASGDVGWFRLYDSDDNVIMDGTVSATGGGGDLTMSTVTVSSGLDVNLTSGSVTMPEGG